MYMFEMVFPNNRWCTFMVILKSQNNPACRLFCFRKCFFTGQARQDLLLHRCPVYPKMKKSAKLYILAGFLELVDGLEPPTCWLQVLSIIKTSFNNFSYPLILLCFWYFTFINIQHFQFFSPYSPQIIL